MIDALARLAPLAIELMHQRHYAQGGYAHPSHYAHGGIGHAAHAMHGYQLGGMPRYADGGDMDGQQLQQGQPQEGHPMGGAPDNGMTQYVQPEPNLNAPMAPYAHGGHVRHNYMHGGYAEGGEGHYMPGHGPEMHHYSHGGDLEARGPIHTVDKMGYARGGHMPHYAWGGALKGAYQSANGQRPQQGAPMMGQRPPMGRRPMPMGAGPHQQRPMQPKQQMPQPPQSIEMQQPQQGMPSQRRGGAIPHRNHGGELYPYVR